MTVPGWLYWITYILVPIAAGIWTTFESIWEAKTESSAPRFVRHERRIGIALLASGLINTFEFVRMTGDMNPFGFVLYFLILGSQFGLGFRLAFVSNRANPRGGRGKKRTVDRVLGWIAISTAFTMLLVRAQVVWIFG